MPSSSSTRYKSLLLIQISNLQYTNKHLEEKDCTSKICSYSWQLQTQFRCLSDLPLHTFTCRSLFSVIIHDILLEYYPNRVNVQNSGKIDQCSCQDSLAQ